MAEMITSEQLDIPGFKRKPEIDCPPHGLVINPSTGLVSIWSPDIRTAGDILETYDVYKHSQAVVPDDIRAGGLRIAGKYGSATTQRAPAVNTNMTFTAPAGFTLPAGFEPLPQPVSNW